MKRHEAAVKLVKAEKALLRARNICVSAGVIDEITIAFNHVWDVGESLYPGIIDEIRRQKADIG